MFDNYDDMDTSYMDSPDWQDSNDLNTAPGYANSDISWSPEMQNQWNSGNNQYNFDAQLSNVPMGNWSTQGTDWGAIDQATGSQFTNPMADAAGMMQQLPQGLSNTLSTLFNSKGLQAGLGALLEGQQNKKQARNLQDIVNQYRSQASPFDTAGGADPTSMRGQMQAQLTNAMTNPYSVPVVKQQADQIARAQAIKDAAAGRRSNQATSNPAVLAAQAQIAQNYINSLYNPAGANMSAGSAGLQQLADASRYNTNGAISPLMSALGYNTQRNNNEDILSALKSFLAGSK